MDNNHIFEMADRLKELKTRKKELDEQSKSLGSEIDELDLQLSDAMAEAEVDKFSRNGSTFYLTSRLFASPLAGMKEEMIKALKENGYAAIVCESVNANTLSSTVKELMEQNNDELPRWLSDTVGTYEKVSVGIRKS